jgi:FtsX extracellular domain
VHKRVLVVLGALVVVAGLVVGAVLLFAGDDTEKSAATCANGVSVYFVEDADMLAAAARLRGDDRAGDVRTETGEQAHQRLTARFPDDTAPTGGAVMAAVHLAAADGVDHVGLAEDLAGELPGATGAEPVDCPPAKPAKPELARYAHQEPCGRVNVFFETDEAMLAAKDVVADDPQVQSLEALTKEQSYERAKELFADDPETLKLLTPQDLPAMLELRTEADP